MEVNRIVCGDALEVLKDSPNNSIDLVCTDPPYGYSFMGKDWDKAVPSVEIWQECLRVLKPGAFCMVMSAPRSDVQMHMIKNISDAGFRVDFSPIYHTFASGFPKAGNIGKMVDKRLGAEREIVGKVVRLGDKKSYDFNTSNTFGGESAKMDAPNITAPATSQAKALDGSYAGFQPKPAVEVIIVAMKPLSEKTFVDQALKNRKGITWLDDCRVPTGTESIPAVPQPSGKTGRTYGFKNGVGRSGDKYNPAQGRFPANLLVSDDVLNDGRVQKSGTAVNRNRGKRKKSTVNYANHNGQDVGFGDSGSYSRYFDLDKWYKTLPFIITPKASKSEKNKGLEQLEEKESLHGSHIGRDLNNPKVHLGGMQSGKAKNHHPTVKPLKLMSYLITLGSREKDIVLDPFVGSGTTCIAAKQLGRKYIGIEREAEYVEIAEERLKHTDKFKHLEQTSLL